MFALGELTGNIWLAEPAQLKGRSTARRVNATIKVDGAFSLATSNRIPEGKLNVGAAVLIDPGC